MSGKVPYADVKDARVLALLTAGERPPRTRKIDNHLWGILLQCWAQKPAERPTAKSLLVRMLVPFSVTSHHIRSSGFN